jgi:hypothetical protein
MKWKGREYRVEEEVSASMTGRHSTLGGLALVLLSAGSSTDHPRRQARKEGK